MSRRRAKLSSAERERRAEKRARRAEEAPEREARRRVRSTLRRSSTTTMERIRSAMLSYSLAIEEGLRRERGEVELVVCETCGLVQSNLRGTCDMPGIEGWPAEAQRFYGTGLVQAARCQSVGCSGVYAISVERYEEETPGYAVAS